MWRIMIACAWWASCGADAGAFRDGQRFENEPECKLVAMIAAELLNDPRFVVRFERAL